jgi:hypothetical protein
MARSGQHARGLQSGLNHPLHVGLPRDPPRRNRRQTEADPADVADGTDCRWFAQLDEANPGDFLGLGSPFDASRRLAKPLVLSRTHRSPCRRTGCSTCEPKAGSREPDDGRTRHRRSARNRAQPASTPDSVVGSTSNGRIKMYWKADPAGPTSSPDDYPRRLNQKCSLVL